MGKSIDDGTGVETEYQHRAVAEGAKERERERRIMRKLKDEPRGRHRLHPGADDGHRLSDKVAAELRVLEGGNLHEGATARLDSSRSGANGA